MWRMTWQALSVRPYTKAGLYYSTDDGSSVAHINVPSSDTRLYVATVGQRRLTPVESRLESAGLRPWVLNP
jgi:hypothetical protein